MSFNKRILPTVNELETILTSKGSKYFYSTYVKSPDLLIGSDESIQFVDTFANQYENV